MASLTFPLKQEDISGRMTWQSLAANLTLSGSAFSVVCQARRGGGGLRGPDAKNQG